MFKEFWHGVESEFCQRCCVFGTMWKRKSIAVDAAADLAAIDVTDAC